MQQRVVLVIHTIRVVRTLLKQYILSELHDTQVVSAASAAEGLRKLNEQTFQVVVCGREMAGTDGPGIYHKMKKIIANQNTPFILITSSKIEEELQTLEPQGLYCMHSPFTSADLTARINRVCDPRSWRRHARVNVPNTQVLIHLENDTIVAELINISMTGILCEFEYSEEYTDLMRGTHLAVEFAPEFDGHRLENLWCNFLRLFVLSWTPHNVPERVRGIWQFIDPDPVHLNVLSDVFEKVEKRFGK